MRCGAIYDKEIFNYFPPDTLLSTMRPTKILPPTDIQTTHDNL